MMEFRFTRNPIRLEADSPSEAGGIVEFDGRVRRYSEGREVESIEYEAFEPMALKEGERILERAIADFGLLDARCTHRLGRLALGESAVRVFVAARHRKEAFEACAWIMDELKRSVPIWKKERYTDGDSDWILNQDGTQFPERAAESPTSGTPMAPESSTVDRIVR